MCPRSGSWSAQIPPGTPFSYPARSPSAEVQFTDSSHSDSVQSIITTPTVGRSADTVGSVQSDPWPIHYLPWTRSPHLLTVLSSNSFLQSGHLLLFFVLRVSWQTMCEIGFWWVMRSIWSDRVYILGTSDVMLLLCAAHFLSMCRNEEMHTAR